MDNREEHIQAFIDEAKQLKTIDLRFFLSDLTAKCEQNALYQIYEALVEEDWARLQYIGESASKAGISESQFDQICLKAVKKDMYALAYIRKESRRSWVLNTLGKDFILAAVKNNALSLRSIPEKDRNFEILMTCIKNDPMDIMFTGDNAGEAGVTVEEYAQLCLEAFKRDNKTIKYINNEAARYAIFSSLSKEDALVAVKMDPALLKYVHAKDKSEILSECIMREPGAFAFAGRNPQEAGVSEDEYCQLCLHAARNNFFSLAFMDDSYKEYVLDAPGFETSPQKVYAMLVNNYAYVRCFPQTHLSFLPQFLSSLEHIVVSKAINEVNDQVNDGFMVYANAPSRKGKITHVDKDTLPQLLADMDKYLTEKKPLNLVLLDAFTTHDRTLANLEPSAIAKLLAEHRDINRVTLLGCITAKVKPLEQEKAMAQKYKDTNTAAGFILMNRQPDEAQMRTFFEKQAYDKNGAVTNTLYVWVNEPEAPCILKLKRDEKGMVTGHRFEVSEANKEGITRLITRGKRQDLPMPRKPQEIVYYRTGKGAEFISAADSDMLMGLLAHPEHPRFSRGHPEYKADKQLFPFLTSADIGAGEEDKILPSLLKDVKKAIEKNENIQQQVVVKGYTKLMHVDTREQRMTGSRTPLYTSEYDDVIEGGNPNRTDARFFADKRDNIKRKKLDKERSSDMDANVDAQDESNFKSVKWTHPGK